MKKRVSCVFAFVFLCINLSFGFAEPAHSVQKQIPQTAKHEVLTVPAGNTIRSVLTTPVESAYLRQGHVITMVLTEDLYYNNEKIIPSDSIIFGSVISVKNPNKPEAYDEIFLRFTQIVTPSGVQIPIAALIKTKDGKGLIFGNDDYLGSDNGHVSINVGTPFDLFLTQPITVNPEVYNSNY